MVLVLGLVTARSRIFSHRTAAHGPHKTTSPSAPIVHSPAGDRIVATPSFIWTSPATKTASCLYRTPASWESTSRARSRRRRFDGRIGLYIAAGQPSRSDAGVIRRGQYGRCRAAHIADVGREGRTCG